MEKIKNDAEFTLILSSQNSTDKQKTNQKIPKVHFAHKAVMNVIGIWIRHQERYIVENEMMIDENFSIRGNAIFIIF